MVDLVRPQAVKKGLEMNRLSGERTLPLVLVDPIRLRQCLFNLIGNAV